MRKYLYFLPLMGLMLSACGTTGGRSTAHLPDRNSPAASAYANRCGSCHAIPHPKRYRYEVWLRTLPLMEKHIANRNMGAMSMDEQVLILSYLKQYAR